MDGCWVVLSHEGPVRATVFADEGSAYKYAYQNHSASVEFQQWGEVLDTS